MPVRSPPEPPESPGEARPTTQALYEEHWAYVFRLLPGFGIWGEQAASDVAQDVWLTVHRRLGSYDAAVHQTPRAWLTGVVWRCAANHRRAWRRRRRVFAEDSDAQLDTRAAPGLSPEEAALLRTLEQAVTDEDQRHALYLHICHGLTVEEVAAVQGVSKSRMERRLTMARKQLGEDKDKKDDKDDEGDEKLGAFLGFGSLEALGEALRPKAPIPDEVGEELWRRIEEQIRQQGDGEASRDDAPPEEGPPARPPAAAEPAACPAGPGAAVLTLTKGTLVALVAGAFLTGNIAGLAGALAWHVRKAEPHELTAITLEASPVVSAPASSVRLPAAPSSPASVAPLTPSAAPRSAGSATAIRSITAPRPSGSAADSGLMILQMRRAAAAANFDLVLTLADEHARRFGARQAAERETERLRALQHLGRTSEAEQHARAVAATYPEHRAAMVRAVERASP